MHEADKRVGEVEPSVGEVELSVLELCVGTWADTDASPVSVLLSLPLLLLSLHPWMGPTRPSRRWNQGQGVCVCACVRACVCVCACGGRGSVCV